LIIVLLVLAAMVAATLGSHDQTPVRAALGSTALAFAAILSFLGPTWIRNDLRSDMNYLGLLRTLPLQGKTIVAAEIIGSTLSLTALQAVLLLGGYAGLAGTTDLSRFGSLELLLALALPAALVVNAIGMTIQNAAALLFPSWMRFDAGRPGGFETLGQNILSSLFTILLSALALAGPVLAGWLVWTWLALRLGPWVYVPMLAGIALIGWLELRVLLGWLGRVFDRTESIL
jgi:hypothetical protein